MSTVAKTAVGLAAANVLDSLATKDRERAKLWKLSRRNAEWRAGLPADTEDEGGVINIGALIQTLVETGDAKQGIEGDSAGEAGGQAPAEGGTGDSGGSGGPEAGSTDTTGQADNQPTAGGSDHGGTGGADGGPSQGTPSDVGSGDPGKVSTGRTIWKWAKPILIAGGSLGAAGLIAGYLLWPDPKPTPPPAIQERQSESILQWLEDESYHLPQEE